MHIIVYAGSVLSNLLSVIVVYKYLYVSIVNISSEYIIILFLISIKNGGFSVMKKEITKMPLCQNAKITAILSSIASLLFLIPVAIFLYITEESFNLYYFIGLIILPVFHFVCSYIFMLFFCFIYNVLVKFFGGFVYECENL